jgi:hypothetical protein
MPAAKERAIDPPELGAQRDAARQMFEAKEVDYNPRKPFYLTIAGLVTAGACSGGYVWWQMQPRYAVNTAAVQNAPKGPPPVAPAPVAAATGAEQEIAPPASPQAAPLAAAPIPQSPSARGGRDVAPTSATEKPAPSTFCLILLKSTALLSLK